MTVESITHAPLDAEHDLNMADELAAALKKLRGLDLPTTTISSWRAWNRRDVDGYDNPDSHTQHYRGGALEVQVYYRDSGQEKNSIFSIDDDRRPVSEAAVVFLGAMAAQQPPSHCNSFVQTKL